MAKTPDSYDSFQAFLDGQQYTKDGIRRYEYIFGETYVSTGLSNFLCISKYLYCRGMNKGPFRKKHFLKPYEVLAIVGLSLRSLFLH